MDYLPTFFANNLFLCSAFIVVLVMTIRAEILHQSNKANDLSPLQATRFMNNENAIVIDVNDSKEFESGHIKSAINVPMAELSSKMSDLEKYKNKAVLTCCKHGNQSSRACKQLRKSGFNNTFNISGGLHSWLEANLPVTKTNKA